MSTQPRRREKSSAFADLASGFWKLSKKAIKFSWSWLPILIMIILIVIKTTNTFPVSKTVKEFVEFVPTVGLLAGLVSVIILAFATLPVVGIDRTTGTETFLVEFGLPFISWLIVGLSVVTMKEIRDQILNLSEEISEEISP